MEKARCQYAVDWLADKHRWKLTADAAEKTALDKLAGTCPRTTVSYIPAP